MNEIKTDRRVRKTRSILRENLVELLKEKELKDITVKELSERSDINRGTFYLHYKDIFDMMDQIQQEMIVDFNTILDACQKRNEPLTPYPVLLEIFQYIQKNKEITKVLLGPHGDLHFLNGMKSLVKEHIHYVWTSLEMNVENFEFYNSYCISGILGLIESWLLTDSNKTPEEMARLSNGIVLETLKLFYL